MALAGLTSTSIGLLRILLVRARISGANVAENSVLFAGYGVCQKIVAKLSGNPEVSELSTFYNGCAGFIAAFFSSLVLCPTELVKCRLQVKKLKFMRTNNFKS